MGAPFVRRTFGKNTNIEPYQDLIKRIINESDLILEVLDARLVELSRNEEVERLIEEVGRPLIFVLNKSDLVNKNRLTKQIEELEKTGSVVFVSNKNKVSYKILLYAIRKTFNEYGKREASVRKSGDPKVKFREAKGDIVVGILGYPNVGKSSIINGLAHKKKVKVSKKAGTTHGIHWIKASEDIKLIDSPGVIPLGKDDDLRYGLIGARDEEKLKHPDVVADAIINLFLKNDKENLEKTYGINISNEELENEDTYAIILKIAEKKRYLLKGAVADENRVYNEIVRDWQDGKLRL